jgi:colanic acid/amylovoran biosynthesis glycosyltransferase
MRENGGRDLSRHPEAVGHVVHRYLNRSETFIYTALRFQTAFRPIVFARFTDHLDEFPICELRELRPDRRRVRRAARRLAVLVGGYSRDGYDFELGRGARAAGCVALHAHFGPTGSRSLQAAKRLGVPLVTTFYGRDVSDSFGCSYDALFRDGDVFVCEGPAMAESLRDTGCPAERIRLVRIGIDLALFEYSPPTRSSPFIVLQAARFVEKKGIDLSIRAFASALPSLQAAELWLLGDGELRHELEALALELGVANRVRFLGMLSHGEYQAVIRAAHVAIQPSRTAVDGDTEGGAPTVLLEMQASGIPIVATKHADIPFVVPRPDRLVKEEDVDGLAAALVEIASISDTEYRGRAEQGRTFVEETHDARVTAEGIAAVYREALVAR